MVIKDKIYFSVSGFSTSQALNVFVEEFGLEKLITKLIIELFAPSVSQLYDLADALLSMERFDITKLYCYDLDGDELWHKACIGKKLLYSSDGNALFVIYNSTVNDEAEILKLDPSTGEALWKWSFDKWYKGKYGEFYYTV